MVNVEPLGRHNAAVRHQMDEEPAKWLDPQEGVKDGSEAMRECGYLALATTTGHPSPNAKLVAVDITNRVRHNPAVVAEG